MSKGKTDVSHLPLPIANTMLSPTFVQPSTQGTAPKAVATPQRGAQFKINGIVIPVDISMHSISNIVQIINSTLNLGAVAGINRDGSLVVSAAPLNPEPVFSGDSATLVALGLQ